MSPSVFWAGANLLKLHNDVQTCGYEDVQVMWEILRRSESELMASHPKRKQRPFWRVFVWSNHSAASSFSANHSWYKTPAWYYVRIICCLCLSTRHGHSSFCYPTAVIAVAWYRAVAGVSKSVQYECVKFTL